MLFWIILKTICEMVGMFYLAMWVVGIFNWQKRLNNPVYRFFDLLASPFTKFVRLITPAAVSDARTRVVGACLVAVLWLVCVFEMGQICRAEPTHAHCAQRLERSPK